jgi:hypothetical protein
MTLAARLKLPASFREAAPASLGVLVYAALICVTLIHSVSRNEGHLVYAVDDTYIHMAMSKNLARYGVWGVTRYEFSASSSSPLWTLLLAGVYRLFGVSDVAPLVLNIVIGIIALIMVDRLARDLGAPLWQRFIAVIGAVFLGPMVFLTFVAMEHLLHAALVLAFMILLLRTLKERREASAKVKSTRRHVAAFGVLGAALMATRYESVILLGLAAVVLLVTRRFRETVAMVAGAATPVLIVGLIQTAYGGVFLPSSVAVKGFAEVSPLTRGLGGILAAFNSHRMSLIHVATLATAAILLALGSWLTSANRQTSEWGLGRTAIAGLSAITALLQIALLFPNGQPMNLRYSGYLSLLGCAVVGGIPWGATLRDLGQWLVEHAFVPRRSVPWLGAAAFVALVPPVLLNMLPVFEMTTAPTVTCTDNIYRQQFQMARLAASLPHGTTVALNDIGAVCYYADIRCLDLIGLATADIARARLRLRHRPRSAIAPVLSDLVRRKKRRLTMVYVFAFSDKDALNPRIWEPCVPQYLPQELVPLGVWLTPRNVVCAGPMVSFYAFDRDDVEVRSRFLEATRRLPRDMVTRIFP